MKRREFITLIGGVAVSPFVARAQQPVKMKRIAMVHSSESVANMVASYHRFYRAFFDEVSRFGFVEGKSLVVERYSAGGNLTALLNSPVMSLIAVLTQFIWSTVV
jgi:putative tryptophan/tyrosine transport system substrate-binding protein